MASQGSGCMPTSGTLSGLTLVQLINAANKAFITMNSGATAPLTDCTGLSQLGQPWLDTGTNTVKQYDGASWLTWGVMDTSNHIWQPPVGGGSASVVSGSVTDVWSVAPSVVTITGTTTITSLANSSAVPGTLKFVKFAASLTLTNNAAIALPGAANIVTVAGDSALVLALTSTNVQVLTYWRNSGAALSSPSVFTGAVFFNSPLTPTALSGTTNDYNPTGLATANVIRISATGTQYLTGIVAPATDGKILSLYNVGTGTILLATENSNSTAANRFSLRSTYSLRGGGSVLLIYDATAARWKLLNEPTTQSIAGGFKTLLIKNSASAPTTTMDITADQITVEEVATGRAHRLVGVSVSPVMTASGANGLDTGTIVNNVITWYYSYVIYNPSTDGVAGLFSAQSSCGSVTLPAGYTFCARVGAVRTDGAATARWMGMRQAGRRVQYVLGVAQTTVLPTIATGPAGTWSGTTPTWTTPSVANFVPPTAASIRVLGLGNFNGLGSAAMLLAPSNSYGGLFSTKPAPVSATDGGNSGYQQPWMADIVLEGTSIAFVGGGAGSVIQCMGYEDNL